MTVFNVPYSRDSGSMAERSRLPLHGKSAVDRRAQFEWSKGIRDFCTKNSSSQGQNLALAVGFGRGGDSAMSDGFPEFDTGSHVRPSTVFPLL